jgi:hypothetical protein
VDADVQKRPRTRTSPRGDEFEVVGRAAPIRSGIPHVPAEAREELLEVKEGGMFLCARPDVGRAGGKPSRDRLD